MFNTSYDLLWEGAMAALKVIVGEEQSLEVQTPDQCAASDKNKEGVIRKKKT